jgi:hypothetical protein
MTIEITTPPTTVQKSFAQSSEKLCMVYFLPLPKTTAWLNNFVAVNA